jgi:tetratricopeptide (TPR) repeat protein
MARAKRKSAQQPVTRGTGRRVGWIAAAIALLLAVALVAFWLTRSSSENDEPIAVFPPPAQAPPDSVHFDDFAGSEVCAACHTTQFAAWSTSTHGRAGQAPPGDLLLRRFDGAPIRFRDAMVQPRVNGGQFEFVVEWAGRTDRFPIVGAVGAGHMIGGGTQGFLWRHADGSLRLLPFEIASTDSTWFCSTGTRANRGWVPIDSTMSIADCGDWPPVRVLGSTARYASCQECHGSQIEMTASDRPHNTRFQSLSINCESCHGPARRHIDLINSKSASTDIGLQPLATLSKDSSVTVCLRCHALKVDVRRGYLPGRDLEQRYSLALPLLDSDELYADGRTRTFAYQQGHLYSDCYLSGSMTCVDCHEPHGQQYRDINGRKLVGRFDDAQCTDCHASKAVQPELHTRHARNSTGSRCVACHMPFIQESAVGNQIRYTRSDHTISAPRPEVDQKLGVVNACRTCHQDRSNEQLAADTRNLWGQLKPLRPIIAQLIEGNAGKVQEILLAADTTHSMAYFDALSRYFSQLDAPDAKAIRRKMQSHLWQLTQSANDDRAALALATLHLDRGNERETRNRLIARLQELGQREPSVRRRWAIALGHRGDAYRERNRTHESIALYRKALELVPNDGAYLLALGQAHLSAGDAASATRVLEQAVANDPRESLNLVNYGRARAALGDEGGAEQAYRQATTVNPYDALAFFNLGNSLYRQGNRAAAADAYRRAIELDLSLAPAHFNLARVFLADGRNRDALQSIRQGLIFDPNHTDAREMATQLEAQLGQNR